MKPTVFRPEATEDVVRATLYYEVEQIGLGERFTRQIEALVQSIELNPNIGSQRFQHVLPAARVRHVAQFPYLIFYVELAHVIDIIRILHVRRDIPSALEDISANSR